MTRLLARAAATLMRMRMRLFSVFRTMIAPRLSSPATSVTVRMCRPRSACRVRSMRGASLRPMNRMLQPRDLVGILESPDGQRAPLERLAANDVVDDAAERIIADDADDEGRGRRGVGRGRPFDELAEVEQIGGLHLVFGQRRRRPGSRAPQRRNGCGDQDQPAAGVESEPPFRLQIGRALQVAARFPRPEFRVLIVQQVLAHQ